MGPLWACRSLVRKNIARFELSGTHEGQVFTQCKIVERASVPSMVEEATVFEHPLRNGHEPMLPGEVIGDGAGKSIEPDCRLSTVVQVPMRS